MDENNYSINKIPYDDTPIFRAKKSNLRQARQRPSKIFTLTFIALFVLNIALCITCGIYLSNGKIKNVNYYYDTYSSQQVTYLENSMRSAKSHVVSVAAGLSSSTIILPGQSLTNDQFYGSTISHGAGFFYKQVGNIAYFVTCYHVINYYESETFNSSTRIWILPTSMLIPVEVSLVSYSAKDDVAVLKCNVSKLEGAIPVSTFDSTFIEEYEDIFAIGNPLNLGIKGTAGKVTAYRQLRHINGMSENFKCIATDIAINPGNSGGPVFNSEGKFIGMVNVRIATSSSGEPVSNIAFAIPGTLVCSIADYIIENNLNQTSKPLAVDLGVVFDTDENMGVDIIKDVYSNSDGKYAYVEMQHVIISDFESASSIAKQQGLQKNDRLVSVELELYGDKKVVVPFVNEYIFYEYAYAIKPGSEMKFVVERQNYLNETITLEVSVLATYRSYN